MVPLIVPAIIICHVVTLDPLHGPRLLPREAAGPVGRGGDGVAPGRGVGGATGGFEAGEFSDEGLVAIIGLIFTILGCP